MRVPSASVTPGLRLPYVLLCVLFAALCGLCVWSRPALASNETAGTQIVQTQRAISDDVVLDQSLVAMQALGDQRTASLPGMRALVVPHFSAIWPTHGIITTYYGEVGPFSPRGHSGIDVAGPRGTPVEAMDSGDVLKAYWDTEGYGGLVVIAHPSGYETWYAHLAALEVEPGQTVHRGEEIGLMGSTGFSTGPHLHFEVRQDGNLVDPMEFLSEDALEASSS